MEENKRENRIYIDTLLLCDVLKHTDLIDIDKMECIYESKCSLKEVMKGVTEVDTDMVKFVLNIFYHIIRIKGDNEEYLKAFKKVLESLRKNLSWDLYYNNILRLNKEIAESKKKKDILKAIQRAKIVRCFDGDEIRIKDKDYGIHIPLFEASSGMCFKLRDSKYTLSDKEYVMIVYKSDSIEYIERDDTHTRKEKMKLVKEYLNESTELIVIAYNEDENRLIDRLVRV